MSIKKRLEHLEEREREAVPSDFGSVFRKALTLLPDEDLEALADALDQGARPADEGVYFERLYGVVDARGKWGLDALFGAMDAVRKGGERWG